MKILLLFVVLSMVSANAIAGKTMGCIWAEAKLDTAIKMQADYEEKQRYYVKENGSKSDSYEFGKESAHEDEREARAEVNRKCE